MAGASRRNGPGGVVAEFHQQLLRAEFVAQFDDIPAVAECSRERSQDPTRDPRRPQRGRIRGHHDELPGTQPEPGRELERGAAAEGPFREVFEDVTRVEELDELGSRTRPRGRGVIVEVTEDEAGASAGDPEAFAGVREDSKKIFYVTSK
jgi:hypothetical protein